MSKANKRRIGTKESQQSKLEPANPPRVQVKTHPIRDSRTGISNAINGAVRVEEDALGNVEVPSEHLWGAQTERSRNNFPIGVERYRWGRPVIQAPGIRTLRDTLDAQSRQFSKTVMVGRTHLQDATPLTLGQVVSGWVAQLDEALEGVRANLGPVYALAIGGTAVGTGLNADPRFGE